jgi:hypothetical protein
MRFFSCVCFLLVSWGLPLYSQERDILENDHDGIHFKIESYGIYQTEVVRRVPEPLSPGNELALTKNEQFLEETTHVPQKMGTSFGFQYSISSGTEPGSSAPIELIRITKFPSPMVDNAAGTSSQYSIFKTKKTVNSTTGTGYTLESARELLPGTWTLAVVYGTETVLRMSFTVEQ